MTRSLIALTVVLGACTSSLGGAAAAGAGAPRPEVHGPSTALTPTATRVTQPQRFKILLLQGANLSYLGRREPELYGTISATELDSLVRAHAVAHGYDLTIYYTHIEGDAIGRLYQAVDERFDGVVMNPGGFTYAGYALRDCLRALPFPYVEVHMTNSDKRGIHSVTAEVAVGVIAGFGTDSYLLGLDAMLNWLRKAAAKRP